MENARFSHLMTRVEAAHYLGVSPSTLARWAHLRTGVRFHKVGRRTLYKVSDLDAFIESQAVEPVEDIRLR